jgi:HK97 family phage major capsid protein
MDLTEIKNAFDAHAKAVEESIKGLRKDVDFDRDRLEELESKASMARGGGSRLPDGVTRDMVEHKKIFIQGMRGKFGDASIVEQLRNAEADFAKKAMSIGTPAAGGYAVPELIARDINRLEKKFSPVRDLVKVVPVSTSDYKELVNLRGHGAAWVGETGTRNETNTSQLRECAPTFGELYAYPKATNWAMADVFFDLAAWLSEESAQQFAITEGQAVISGSGSNQPTGMTHTAPVTTADFASPLRAAAAYQFVPCVTTQSPAVAEITMDPLITLLYSVNATYRANGNWVMNSLTAASIRKLKDMNGQYLWQPSSIVGQPDRLLGYPVAIWEDMDDVGTNKLPVAFGDFRRAYTLADRGQLELDVDRITTPGYTKFYVRRRVGGIVTNNDAIKFAKTTLS